MSKKLHSKLLSVILCIAICCATVFGCMLNVSAAYSGTYTFSGGIAAYGAKQASVDLTFDLTDGFAGGDFAVVNTANNDFTDVTVKVKRGKTLDGSAFDASNIVAQFKADASGTYLGYVTFLTNNLKYYTSLTLELTYTMKDWVQHNGNKYAVDIAELVIATEFDSIEPTFTGSAGYIHSHHAWLQDGTLDPTTAEDGYHLVYDTNCRICSSQFAIKQVMPNYTQIDGATGFDKYPNSNLGISGINVEYNDDGTVNLKIHGYSPYYRSGNYIVVTDTEGKIYDKYELKTNTTSQYAGNVLVDNAQVWTLENMSARDIDTELLFTMFYNDNGTIRAGSTVSFSLADYCVNVVEGNAVWTDDATTEQIKADKDVAAALYYYGAAIDDSVFDTSTGSGTDTTTVTPVEKVTAVWQDTSKWCQAHGFANWDAFIASMEGNGEEATPYLITTAEQLYYLTSVGSTAANTTGKYFKVDDSVGAFNFMNNANATPNTTATELLAGNTTWNKFYDESAVFAGNFDGNGAVVYNFIHRGNKAGLFTTLGKNSVVKNISVASSVFVSTNGKDAKGAGGIFGQVDGSWNGETVTIENCKVTNCYIKAEEYTGGNTFGAGAIGGYAHALTIKIDKCFVADNIIENASNGSKGGLIATGYTTASSVKNTVVLGVTPYNKWAANIYLQGCEYQSFAKSSYSNVYTDQPKTDCYSDKANTTLRTFADTEIKVISPSDAKGANAVTNLKLNPSLYIATNDFPVLKSNYQWTAVSDGEDTHTYKAAVSLDGVVTNYTANTEAHNMVESEDGKKATCSACGYSKEIVGNINYVDKITVTWNGSDKPTTFADSGITGGGTDRDPYIIKTAAQLWYIAQAAGAETAGMHYKVDDTIGAFDMQNNTWGLNDNSTYFQGIFDGNGVQIVNFKASGWNIGLFPRIAGDVTIKNIKVANATVSSSGGDAGVIVGSIATTANATISGCVVINSTVSGKCGAGAIIGSAGAQTLVVENCFVANNEVDANTAEANTTEYKDNAVIGYGHTSTRTLNNTIAIGNDPSIRVDYASNVYTDLTSVNKNGITTLADSQLKGANALTNMTFEDASVWMVTDSYPDLSVFHKMQLSYIDDNTHGLVCGVIIDGVQCTTCGPVKSHTMVEDTENQIAECECGYSYEIKGIYSLGLPESIINHIKVNSTFTEKFATNAAFKSAYGADDYHDITDENCWLYTSSLNLKTNPHIAFTFVFHDTYKTNRANISVTFTTADGSIYNTEKVETDGVLGTNWVNNAGAGRYHLYRFKDLPVKKLCQRINVTLNYGNETRDFGSYSAAGYAINAMNAGADYVNHVNAAMALVYYSEMLAARYGA